MTDETMTDETPEETPKLLLRWGYSKQGPKLFEVPAGEGLPKGYFDSPAKVPSDKARAPKAKKAK